MVSFHLPRPPPLRWAEEVLYRLSPPRPFLHHGKAPGHREILWLFGTQWSVVDPPEASDAFYFPPPFPH